MRAAAIVVFGAAVAGGCGFSVPGPTSDDVTGDDTQGTHHALVDDTADDFTGHTSSLVDGVIAARGAIEPDGFVTNGLHATSYPSHDRINSTTTNWNAFIQSLPPKTYEAWSVLPQSWGNGATPGFLGRPRGLNINDENNYSVVFDGEAYLPAGAVDVTVAGDDHAIVQFSLAGTWTPLIYDGYETNPDAKMTINVPAAGWYPIRAAMEETIGDARLDITLVQGTTLIHLDGNSLRARVTNSRGLVLHAWNAGGFNNDVGESSLPSSDIDFMSLGPRTDQGLGSDTFTLRLTGQILILEEAHYTFSVTTDMEKWRVMVDGQLLGNTWVPQISTPAPDIVLEPGWHDLLVDYIEGTGNANLHLRVVGGAASGLNGPVPADRLRPVAAQGRLLVLPDTDTHNLVDANGAPGVTAVVFNSKAVEGATLDLTDWLYAVHGRTAQEAAQVTGVLVCLPSNKTSNAIVAPDSTYLLGVGLSDTSCAGEPFNGMWKFVYTDNQMGGATGNATDLVAATYHGGSDRRPFAQTTEYTSNPIPTPGAKSYGEASFTADAHGATVQLSVRTGDDEDALKTAPWAPVENGATPDVPAHEMIQYRVTITQDGWQNASVDRVSLIYIAR